MGEIRISNRKLEITFEQDNDCMDSDKCGQFLTIGTDNGGMELEDEFFILKTERWAFDNFDELIETLYEFKREHEKLRNKVRAPLSYNDRVEWFFTNYFETGMELAALKVSFLNEDLDSFEWYGEKIKIPKFKDEV